MIEDVLNKTLLVVDDDPGVVTLVKAIFRSEGWQVAVACNGREAMDRIESTEPDVIVLDLMMAEVDGREFFRRARERGMKSQVLILSAYGSERARQELGADAALAKPFEPESLIAKVEALASASSEPS